MSELVTLVMEPRSKEGKGARARMRREGYTPCIFYGPELSGTVMGKVETARMNRFLSAGHWETIRFNVTLPDGTEEMCIIRELQRHPLMGDLVHIDFMRLLKDRKVTVNVPVRIKGKSVCPGIKEGGVLEALHEIEIETLPMDIPDYIDVDISALTLGETVHIRDLRLNEGLTVLADPEEVLATVAMPRVIDETLALGEDSREVEVVAKGKAAKSEE